jgi:hypothetical protein
LDIDPVAACLATMNSRPPAGKVHNMMSEGTFAGVRGNGEDAPFAVIRVTAIAWRISTLL